MALPPYYKKEPIKIPNEAGLVISLLQNDLLNHRLKHIVPHDQIIKEEPDKWTQFPAIYVRKVGQSTMVNNETLGEDYDTGEEQIGFVWSADILFDLVAHVNTIFNYPPIATDGDNPDNRYQHAKNCLPVMHWIVHTILSENKKYTDPDDSTFQWDTIEPAGFELIDGGYNGSRDVWAILALYRFQFEIIMRNVEVS